MQSVIQHLESLSNDELKTSLSDQYLTYLVAIDLYRRYDYIPLNELTTRCPNAEYWMNEDAALEWFTGHDWLNPDSPRLFITDKYTHDPDCYDLLIADINNYFHNLIDEYSNN